MILQWEQPDGSLRKFRVLHVCQDLTSAEAGAGRQILMFDLTAFSESLKRKKHHGATPEKRTRRPFLITCQYEAAVAAMTDGRAAKVDNPPPGCVFHVPEVLTEEEREIQENSWKIISPLFEKNDIFDKAKRGELIALRAKEVGQDVAIVWRLIYRYLAFGMHKKAMTPNFRARGGKDVPRIHKEGTTKTGRKKKLSVHQGETRSAGRATSFDDLLKFKKAYARYYVKEELSWGGAYYKMLVEMYDVGREVGGRFKLHDGVDPDGLPSINQFKYHSRKQDPLARLKDRTSERRFALENRGQGGNHKSTHFGACSQYQLDSTATPFNLVSSLNPAVPLGLATLYVVTDTVVGTIEGASFTWLPPSWEAAAEALYVTFTDKGPWCAKYGVTLKEGEWDCSEIPAALLVDRQELLGNAAIAALGVNGLNIPTDVAPGGAGDMKGSVELKHRIVKDYILSQGMDGAEPRRGRDPGERHPKFVANVMIEELGKMIINAINHWNTKVPITSDMPAGAVEAGVRPYRNLLRRWYLENGQASPQTRTPNDLRMHLLPRAKATVERDGIWLKLPEYKTRIKYVCDRAFDEEWFARSHNFGQQTLTASYVKGVAETIWLHLPNGEHVQCVRDSEETLENRGFDEVMPFLDRLYTPTKAEAYSAFESKAGLAHQASAVKKNGRERLQLLKQSHGEKSDNQKQKRMAAGRAVEQSIERQDQHKSVQALFPTSVKSPANVIPIGRAGDDEDLDMLIQVRTEKLKKS